MPAKWREIQPHSIHVAHLYTPMAVAVLDGDGDCEMAKGLKRGSCRRWSGGSGAWGDVAERRGCQGAGASEQGLRSGSRAHRLTQYRIQLQSQLSVPVLPGQRRALQAPVPCCLSDHQKCWSQTEAKLPVLRNLRWNPPQVDPGLSRQSICLTSMDPVGMSARPISAMDFCRIHAWTRAWASSSFRFLFACSGQILSL
jgi:hypothetical protein